MSNDKLAQFIALCRENAGTYLLPGWDGHSVAQMLEAREAEKQAGPVAVQFPAPAHDETAWLLETTGGGHTLYWDGGLWIGESPRISGVMQFGLTTTKDAGQAVRFVSRELAEAALKSFRADYRVAIGGAGVWKAAEHMWPAFQAPAVAHDTAPPSPLAEQDKEDAERYRALVASGKYAPASIGGYWGLSLGGKSVTKAELDAAIDAAMGGKESQGGNASGQETGGKR